MPEESSLVRAIVQALPVPVVLSARDSGLVLFANGLAARAFGIPLDELIGSRTPEVYARREDRESVLRIIEAEGGLKDHEVLLKGPEGSTFWALASSEPLILEGKPALCTTFVDVTRRKRTEESVDAARSFAESIIATVREPLVVLDQDLVIRRVNRAFCDTFGLTEPEALGSRLTELGSGEWDIPRLRNMLGDVVVHHEEVSDFEMAHRVPGQGNRTFLLNARRLHRSGDPEESVLLSLEDITDRNRARSRLLSAMSKAEADAERWEHELADVERLLANILRNSPGVAYRCSNDNRWTMHFISDGCRRLTAYEPEELIDNRRIAYADLIHPDDREDVWKAVQSAARERRPFQMEYRIRTKGGEERWVWEQGVAVYQDGEPVALEGVIHDISGRRKAEEDRRSLERQLRAGQRMEAVGRLAGGVAHDFNNLLTVIQGYAGLLREDLPETGGSAGDLDAIVQAAERAAHLTGQLLAFSRRQVQELRVVNLNETVGELDKMLRRLIGEDVELQTNLSQDLGLVRVDVTQIEQVLMNLVVNARDAMPEGGRLTIETANAVLDEAYSADKEADVAPGHYTVLAVTDTGTGMDRETQSQVFDPFFTTKEKGRGTGLGLSTVYGIVKQSGGYIWMYSEPDRGTTFKIYLPHVDKGAPQQVARQVQTKDLRGTETILLVEDEEPVRRIARRILGGYGYRVLEAGRGEEALVLCERCEEPIDLLLTDVVMPQMSGPELAKRVSEMRPETRVIFTSGYTGEAVSRHAVLDEGANFIQKPFNAETLGRKIREILDEG